MRAALAALGLLLVAPDAAAAGFAAGAPWWAWPLALFAVCFVLGVIAVPAGVGGGVLFVPIVSALFPFHIDFVRGAGLLLALASSLSSGPWLLRNGLANLRLALPLGLMASAGSIGGAFLGLALPARAVETALGVVILGIVLLMAFSRGARAPHDGPGDRLAAALQMNGVYRERDGREIVWEACRTREGLALFAVIGVLAGLFGLGAGWANVPALNLLMGVPLKVAAGTSGLIITLSSSAAWVYLNQGAVLPMVAAPSIMGMMLGARIGARLLAVLPAAAVRRAVIAVLLFAGLRALGKGTGLWT